MRANGSVSSTAGSTASNSRSTASSSANLAPITNPTADRGWLSARHSCGRKAASGRNATVGIPTRDRNPTAATASDALARAKALLAPLGFARFCICTPEEHAEFLRWLKADHFVFLGARDYDYPRKTDGS